MVLVAAMGILLLLIGFGLGYAFGNGIAGLVIALAIWAVMNLVAYFQGDSILLSMSGAIKIGPDDHPQLYNVVEEMKIASGLEKMPNVYIIDDPALNAFATGRDPNNASVAITSGLLQRLNRDELEGVIGHEVSHIRHRDVLLMAMCSVLLGTIVILAWYGSRVLIFSGGGNRRSSGGGQGQIIILAVAIVLMILAPIMAQLIYYAISRKREYLADASSALYTRYPEGLASALEKIGASTGQLKSANQATAPMYIANPFRQKGRAASDLTATHPPLSERIRILRAMAGGASYVDYDKAYQQVHQGGAGGIMPATALAGAGAVGLRAAGPEAPLKEPEPSRVERTRQVGDLLWQKSGYKIIDCECGTRLKVPSNLGRATVKCPHCGRTHNI